MVLCGSEEARRLGELRDLKVVGAVRESGCRLLAGEEILRLEGAAENLHGVWKTAETLMEYLSGIASSVSAIVAAAHRGDPGSSVVCTRKNFPGTKVLAIKAVLSGGASPHRLSLSETLLVFPEHRVFLAGEAPGETIDRLRQRWPERAIVVEVDREDEARSWIDAGADILQLEKMFVLAVSWIAAYAASTQQAPKIAAAGGVNVRQCRSLCRCRRADSRHQRSYFVQPRDVAVTLESVS